MDHWKQSVGQLGRIFNESTNVPPPSSKTKSSVIDAIPQLVDGPFGKRAASLSLINVALARVQWNISTYVSETMNMTSMDRSNKAAIMEREDIANLNRLLDWLVDQSGNQFKVVTTKLAEGCVWQINDLMM
jgi:hypothetical protein